MEYWHKNDYENGTYTYISDAKGVAIEGEMKMSFSRLDNVVKLTLTSYLN